MSESLGSVLSRARFGAVLASVLLALCVPTVALAANTATFSSVLPKKASTSTVDRPTISIAVYDRYGVRGSTKYSMTLDGKRVTPTISYTKRGDYRRFKLTYRVKSDLAAGVHKVVVKVVDLRKRSSSYSWTFTHVEPEPPAPVDMPVTIAVTSCGTCHEGYPASHPMADCEGCHGEDAPLGAPAYTPADTSAHTLGCTLEAPCHGGGGAFPHVLGEDCATCHSSAYEGMPRSHGAPTGTTHISTSAFCAKSGCHSASLTIEHYKRSVAGVRLSCASCHSSTDARVRSALSAGTTACTGCHDLGGVPHTGTSVAHARPANSCTVAACHDDTDVASIHGGACVACHAPGVVASTTCANCHEGHDHTAAPTAEVFTIDGVDFGEHDCQECHAPLDLVPLHGGGPASCATCHPAARATVGAWTGGCVQGACHSAGSAAPKHGSLTSAHILASAPTCIGADCHEGGTNVAAIHAASDGCATCHGQGKAPTLVCATAGCHGDDDSHPASDPHSAMAQGHTTALPATCTRAGCHASDLKALHAVTKGGPGCVPCHGVDGVGGRLTKDCTASGCHVSDVSSTALHPRYATGHTTAGTGCTTAGCHTANVITLHAGPKCVACHAAGKPALTLACGTFGCHPSPSPAHEAHAVTPPSQTITIAGAPFGVHACSECHTPLDLLDLHANDCASCHPAPATGRTISGGCVQGPCHSSGDLAMHGGIDATHTLTTTPSCIAADCHAGGTNVALIHKTHGGCAACHAAGRTATTSCATTGCHGASDAHPAAAPHPKQAPGHTTGLSTSCAKAGCHSSDLASLHATSKGGPGCVPCHGLNGVGGTTTKDCATAACHPAITAPASHPGYAAKHTLASTPSCIAADCHTGARDVTAIHAGAGCATCHAEGKTPTLLCATSGCHGSGDAHPASAPHPRMTPGHTTGLPVTCAVTGCHTTQLATLHASAGGCATCHTTRGTATRECATIGCHPLASVSHSAHPVTPAAETMTVSGVDLGPHACSECHTPLDLIALHDSACSACHTAGAPARIMNGGCVQSGCHQSGAFAMHGSIDASHALAATPSCMGADCHTGGKNAAAIHKTHGGCAACHGPGKTPTLACGTSGCHGASDAHPAADPHPGMAAAHTTGLTTSCAKTGCHAVDLVALHAGGPRCAACHANADHAASATCGTCHPGSPSVVHAPYIGTKHDPQAGPCTAAGCHAVDVDGTHGAAPGVYSPTGGPKCVPCHTTGPLTTGCLTCHSGAKAPAHTAADPVHTATASCIKADCHLANASKVHAGTTATCGICHNGHAASLTCANCHGPFTPAHPAPAGPHTAPTGTCVKGGCHGSNVATLHGDSASECSACHAEGKTPSLTCSACHGAGFPPGHPAPAEDHTVAEGSCISATCHASANAAALHDASASQCAVCHAPGKTASLACTACHTASMPSLHPSASEEHAITNGCVGANCHGNDAALVHVEGTTNHCESCHATGATPSLNCGSCHFSGPHPHPTCTTGVRCHGQTIPTENHSGMQYVPSPGESNDCRSCHRGEGIVFQHPYLKCHCGTNQSWVMDW